MALSRNDFRSALEPWKGKLCSVLLVSPRFNGELQVTFEDFSLDGVLAFSGKRDEKLEVDFTDVEADSEKLEFDTAIPTRRTDRFDKAALASIDGEFAVTMLFWKR